MWSPFKPPRGAVFKKNVKMVKIGVKIVQKLEKGVKKRLFLGKKGGNG